MSELLRITLLLIGTGLFIIVAFILANRSKSLNNIKSDRVGDGQYGNDHFATDNEVRGYYKVIKLPDEICDKNGEKEMEALAGKFIDSVNVRIGIVKGRMEEIDNEIIFLKKLLKIDMDN